jgi:hypothetical protein
MRKEEGSLLEEELARRPRMGKVKRTCGAAGFPTVVKTSPTGSTKDHPIAGSKFRPAILEAFVQQLLSTH